MKKRVSGCRGVFRCPKRHEREAAQIRTLTCLAARAKQKKRQEIMQLAKDKTVVNTGLKRKMSGSVLLE